MSLVGQTIGPFHLDKELGSGAMGTVYRATYVEDGRVVALKMIAFGLSGNEQAMARFKREGEILKQLKHPNIVRLFATGSYKKTPFIAMEFIEGETLENVLERRTRHTWEEVVAIGKQLCAALQFAHEKGIIHRDLKPANIMVTTDGVVKLTDFGIAKDTDVTALTAANSTLGTAAYMSPEQCKGERNLTHKSDLYSLGVVFYELLTGRKPFTADTAIDMFMKHVEGKFERPSRLALDIPVWLDTLVCQLMEKKPEHRPLDSAMVARALDEVEKKAVTQKSAGADTVNSRRVDRGANTRIEDEDREAARALREKKGKKKKKEAGPDTARIVQAGLLGVALLAVVAVLVVVFRPESAAAVLARAEAQAKADDLPGAVETADDYLAGAGKADDEATEKLRARLREWGVAHHKNRLLAKYADGRPKLSGDRDRKAYDAFDAEAEGNFGRAAKTWNDLKAEAEGDDRAIDRAWAWVAESMLADQQRADAQFARLKKQVEEDRLARLDGAYQPPADEAERAAVTACRYDVFGDAWAADDAWLKARDELRRDPARRDLFLLAAKRARDLKSAPGASDAGGEKQGRVDLIRRRIAEAEAKVTRARNIDLNELVDLYKDSPDPEVKELVAQARARMTAKG